MEHKPYPGIHLSDNEATRVVKVVVGEQPLNPETFAGLRRAMQLETLAKSTPLDSVELTQGELHDLAVEE